ncbi:hypothetical protein DL98DRAFT_532926 [Cadophora sp. DSE1049]|nr:hypothetical protein DL98DRAFT_532926 [Cadophora sp. DSE1049]
MSRLLSAFLEYVVPVLWHMHDLFLDTRDDILDAWDDAVHFLIVFILGHLHQLYFRLLLLAVGYMIMAMIRCAVFTLLGYLVPRRDAQMAILLALILVVLVLEAAQTPHKDDNELPEIPEQPELPELPESLELPGTVSRVLRVWRAVQPYFVLVLLAFTTMDAIWQVL